ncbi:hypothetical protein PC9H_011302 [Pleurotus ostreatus]|uniref:Uncharacterized protein n=1 Tax=Pleurotus ostreatus TaxID=5322 RepID=A0A8H6ZIK4_PLEOS|nr:uncharacterized protein PC9H_011302 [Pleurotus ostreatus]KAF7420784.1 hypothetical protein PC9H_011302 [Pleurotus ostreatus]
MDREGAESAAVSKADVNVAKSNPLDSRERVVRSQSWALGYHPWGEAFVCVAPPAKLVETDDQCPFTKPIGTDIEDEDK